MLLEITAILQQIAEDLYLRDRHDARLSTMVVRYPTVGVDITDSSAERPLSGVDKHKFRFCLVVDEFGRFLGNLRATDDISCPYILKLQNPRRQSIFEVGRGENQEGSEEDIPSSCSSTLASLQSSKRLGESHLISLFFPPRRFFSQLQ
jgi:hypothetical protein